MDKITIVGCGPGSAKFMTQAGITAASQADFLVGNRRLLELIDDVKGEKIDTGVNIEKTIECIGQKRKEGRVALLVSGDPGLFSISRQVTQKFGYKACHLIPGISSIQLAFAKLGISWDDALIISAHAADPEVDEARAGQNRKIAVLLGRNESVKWIDGFIKRIGGGRGLFVCENLGLENERFFETTTDKIGALKLASRTIVLLIDKELVN
ncbi:MAG TPA: precorrin-6y C5,15-methyltransferase (decarboxylating) subunit CbiE [Nitrospirae bacterium]|nr:precorrin-6y C5,15-methyltransferase (decarboxylating) subunit CbiE [Nitrospirota bacterium]